jgi:hypothetical protein
MTHVPRDASHASNRNAVTTVPMRSTRFSRPQATEAALVALGEGEEERVRRRLREARKEHERQREALEAEVTRLRVLAHP